MYRVNYGTGHVSGDIHNRKSAETFLATAQEDCPGAWLEKYEAGTADEPGEWETVHIRGGK